DFGQGTLVPGPEPTCSIPSAVTSTDSFQMPALPSPATATPHLTAIAGSSKPATGAVNLTCIGDCNGSIDFSLSYQTVNGGNWLKITDKNGNLLTKGTVVGKTPFPLNFVADATTLSDRGSPYTAQFTVTGNFKSKTLAGQVI